MQTMYFTLTLSRQPQAFAIPGGASAVMRGVFPGLTGPAVALEVDPAAATDSRVFCFRLAGEETPGPGWTYLGLCWQYATNETAMLVYEEQTGRR